MDVAVLHDPLTGKSRRVRLTLSPRFQGTLSIEDNSENPTSPIEIAVSDLSFSRGGWRGDAITVTWEREGRTWALTVDDPPTIAGLVKDLPPAYSKQIRGWQKQSARDRRWSVGAQTVGALLFLLPFLLVIAFFVMRDRIVDFVVARIPTSVDSEIGERMYRRLAGSGNLVEDGPAVDALRAVSRRFIPHLPTKDFAFRFEVVNDASVNAFAAPGGLVVVHTGLLAKATSVDELAGVLSHEIVHATRRHSLRQIIYDLGLTTTISWVFSIPEGASVTIAGAAMNLSELKFSRDQESEADAGGVELLEKAKLPAGGLQSIFEMLTRETADIPAFLSTHPADEQRLASLEKLVSERGPWNVESLTIDWAAVRLDAETRLKQP